MIERQSGAPYVVQESPSQEQVDLWHTQMAACELCHAFARTSRALIKRWPVKDGEDDSEPYWTVVRPLREAERAHRRQDHIGYQQYIERRAAQL